MAESGTNGASHAEDLVLLTSEYDCVFVVMDEQSSKRQTRGISFHRSGHYNGDEGNREGLGVGLTIMKSIASTLGPKAIVPET